MSLTPDVIEGLLRREAEALPLYVVGCITRRYDGVEKVPVFAGMMGPTPSQIKFVVVGEGDQGQARSTLIKGAKELGAAALFMVDDDTFAPTHAWLKLLDHARKWPVPAVFGAHYNRRNFAFPYATATRKDPVYGHCPIEPDGSLQPVDGMAFGCSIFPKSVLDLVPDELFKDCRATNGPSEDWYGSILLAELGIPCYIDTGLVCRHVDPATGVSY